MKKILVLGNQGMLGHVVERYLRETGKYAVVGVDRSKFDILKGNLEDLMRIQSPDVAINCMGILNKSKDVEAMKKVNSLFPHQLAELSQRFNYRLIHISTDCVFNGTEGFPYSEDSIPCPKDFYGASKAVGEIADDKNLTIRTSIIGPEVRPNGTGLFKWIMDNKGNVLNGYCNAIWTGVTTLELAKAIDAFIEAPAGIINFTFGQISKRDLIQLIDSVYGLGITIKDNFDFVEKRILVSNRKEMAIYPKKSFREMVQELKGWY